MNPPRDGTDLARPVTLDAGGVFPLGPEDAAECKALSDGAGWRHSLADWSVRLALGQGFGLAVNGRLATVGLMLSYPGRAAFLGMLLSDPALRGRGLAARFSRHCIALAHAQGLPLCLIAVPKAAPLYLRLGLTPVAGAGLASFRLDGGLDTGPVSAALRPALPEDMAAIAALDAAALGYDRSALLADTLARGPDFAWVAEADGGVCGFALGVTRGDAVALGPCVAADAPTGEALLRAQLARLPAAHPARLDMPLGREALGAALGLEPAVRLICMTSRPAPALPYVRPGMVFAAWSAIAG